MLTMFIQLRSITINESVSPSLLPVHEGSVDIETPLYPPGRYNADVIEGLAAHRLRSGGIQNHPDAIHAMMDVAGVLFEQRTSLMSIESLGVGRVPFIVKMVV